MKLKLIKIKLLLLSLLPSLLPTTPEQLEKFSVDIIALGGWPDNESFRHAVASMIMHLGPETMFKSKFFFYVSLRKSISNQTAYAAMEALKQQRKAKDGASEQGIQSPT